MKITTSLGDVEVDFTYTWGMGESGTREIHAFVRDTAFPGPVTCYAGTATCQPEDQFRRDVGRLLALNRALRTWSSTMRREVLVGLAAKGVKLRGPVKADKQ